MMSIHAVHMNIGNIETKILTYHCRMSFQYDFVSFIINLNKCQWL